MDEIPADPYKFNEDARKVFLDCLAKTGSLQTACDAALISRSYIYQRRTIDDELATQIDEAKQRYASVIEQEIHRRAIMGVTEDRYHQGMPILEYERDEHGDLVKTEDDKLIVVGHAVVRKYSDTLLLAHARRHIPEYNEKRNLDLKVSGLEGLLAEISDTSGDLPSVDEDLDGD